MSNKNTSPTSNKRLALGRCRLLAKKLNHEISECRKKGFLFKPTLYSVDPNMVLRVNVGSEEAEIRNIYGMSSSIIQK
jgi:hypothetical protein